MYALCCPRVRSGTGWFSALKEALRRVFFSIEETPQPLQPSREKVNQRATALLDQYGEHILRLAYSYLHNQSDAEDILQDTLIQYLRTAPVLESPAHEKAWLLRVAGNLSKNLLRAQGYRQADQLEETLVAQEREDLSYVWDAVKALPVPYREAIHLFYYEGYSTAQIAQILDQKESTVRSASSGGGKAQALIGGGGCSWINRRRTPIVNSWNK